MHLQISKVNIAIIFLYLFFHLITVNAQNENEITIDWIYSDASRELTALSNYFWLNDNTAILYDHRESAEQRVFEKYNPGNNKKEKAIDLKKALASLNSFSVFGQIQSSIKWPLAL